MQACPYDAIYIDPDDAHRGEVQLLRAPGRRRARARLRRRLPDAGDRRRRPRRPGQRDRRSSSARARPGAHGRSRAPAQACSTSARTGPTLDPIRPRRPDDAYIWAKPDARGSRPGRPAPGAREPRRAHDAQHCRTRALGLEGRHLPRGPRASAPAPTLALLAHLLGVDLGALGDWVAPTLGRLRGGDDRRAAGRGTSSVPSGSSTSSTKSNFALLAGARRLRAHRVLRRGARCGRSPRRSTWVGR